ncbi:hypothetical protein [Paraburkholderia tropica]|uniref:hypothetical protein n=1 Tax=Paraburkholderia tropica TaxID=92647 RepID=UPI002AB7BE17|nr:hypothetical protein [Paraburkholderia tropica]
MRVVFVIGLFKSLQRKFDADCGRNGLHNRTVLADIGSKGTLTLLPIERDAIHALRAYLDSLDAYEDAHVVVFPYAPIPAELEDELVALTDLGGTVIRGSNGQDGWPSLPPKKRPDTGIINNAYQRLWLGMPVTLPAEDPLPSEYFRQVADANPQILFAEDVLMTCDRVARHRREFLKRAIDALVDFAADGSGGRIDAFFREKGLDHAQTGGISTTLEVFSGTRAIHTDTTHTHLKQGDKTTPEGAARLYYQVFSHAGRTYVAVLYAGPHPESDVRWTCQLPEGGRGGP